MSINELEEYINKYKHLPGIPSASEVKKNGISVGNMQKRMMEKIEEQSLYIIHQNNKIERLTKKVNKMNNLKKRVKKLEEKNTKSFESSFMTIFNLIIVSTLSLIIFFQFFRYKKISIFNFK